MDIKRSFPCFSNKLLPENGMTMHLSTACNIRCARCVIDDDPGYATSLSRTGMTIMTADGAVDLLQHCMNAAGPPSHVQIGGLGEPLLHAETFILMRKLNAAYPDLPVTVWTNGILLSDRLDEMVRSGLNGIILSIHAACPDTADAFYDWVNYRGRRSTGKDASHFILRRQWSGLTNAIEAGIETTVYTARIPGVNDHEVDRIVTKARSIGVDRTEIVDLGR